VTPPASKNGEPKYTSVLGVPPINSPEDAVKASISKDVKELIRLAWKMKFGE